MSNGDFNMEEYAGLSETGFESRQPVAPEDEFFHSVYIAGKTRKNHTGVEELAGKLQVRGAQYNLDEVYMIITNVKEVLAKIVTVQNKESVECFSYKSGDPWKGTSGRVCGLTAVERASNDFCNNCKSQIVVSGVFCEKNGKPILNDDGKPMFLFIRAKGMKYSNVGDYLNEMYKQELDPIFEPVTEESKKFERSVVNNKRFVTAISIGEATSSFGTSKIFILTAGEKLPKEVVLKVLKISKASVDNFNEKFDWSKRRGAVSTGYGEEGSKVEETQQFPETAGETKETPTEETAEKKEDAPFDFGDLKF